MKPEGGNTGLQRKWRDWAPKSDDVSVADLVKDKEGIIFVTVIVRLLNPTESKTVARYQMDNLGTWETQCIPLKVCDNKP